MKKLFASMIAAAFLLTGSAMAGATKSPTMTSAKKHSATAKSTMMAHGKLAKKAKHTKKHAIKMSAKKSAKKLAKKKHPLKKMMARKLHRKHHKHSAKNHNRM